MFEDFTPSELKSFWDQQLQKDDEARPDEVKAASPPSMTAFCGDFWETIDESRRPNIRSSFNLLFAAWKYFLPKVMGKVPKPSAASPKGNAQYAKLHNELKAYRDREMHAGDQYTLMIEDAFLRGSGLIYHDRDAYRGLARSKHILVPTVIFDRNATCLEDAKHMIIKHSVFRWEFRQKFGKVADDIPATHKASVGMEDKTKDLDIIEYYQAWSKHGGYLRLYSWNKDYDDGYLTEDAKGAGEEWPFVFDDEEWPVTMLAFQRKPDSLWGFSYYESSKSPLNYVQYMVSYILQATKKFAHQTVLHPLELADIAEKMATSQKHLEFVGYDSQATNGRPIKDLVEVYEFPELNEGVFKALSIARENFETVMGYNAMAQANPGVVETASESVRLEGQAESRMSMDVASVEETMKRIWSKECQIDCKLTPRRSVVRIGSSLPTPETVETSQVQEGEQLLTDVPYDVAVLLEAGVKDMESAEKQKSAFEGLTIQASVMGEGNPAMAQQQQMLVQQAQQMLDPAIQARVQYQLPLDIPCTIVEPGVEAYVGQLAQFWIEDMTPRQIKSEIELRIQQGSTSRTGHIQQWNESVQLFGTLWPILQQLQQYDKMAALWNYVVNTLEQFDLDAVKQTPEEIMQAVQMVMQQQMMMQQQANAQAAQQADADRSERKGESDRKERMERDKMAQQERQDERKGRDSRAKDFQKMVADQQKASAGVR